MEPSSNVDRSSTASVATAALLAHQGGWDEILLILSPIVLISGLLVLAKRRVDRAVARAAPEPTPSDDRLDPVQLDPVQTDPAD